MSLLASLCRPQSAHAPRGGPHVTTVVCAVAFVAVANAVSGGFRLFSADGPAPVLLRLLVNLLVAVLLLGYALCRVRVEWSRDAPAVVDHPDIPPVAAGDAAVPAASDWPAREKKCQPRSALKWGRRLVAAATCAAAALAIRSQWGTLQMAFTALDHVHWRDLRWAIYAETLAMVAFAQLTRLLLRAGGVTLRMGPMIGLALASKRSRPDIARRPRLGSDLLLRPAPASWRAQLAERLRAHRHLVHVGGGLDRDRAHRHQSGGQGWARRPVSTRRYRGRGLPHRRDGWRRGVRASPAVEGAHHRQAPGCWSSERSG
jgi:hypothetical protein